MKRNASYAVIETPEGLSTIGVKEGEKPAEAARLFNGELLEDFPNRWLADAFRAELTALREIVQL